jgi:hypothetical protein
VKRGLVKAPIRIARPKRLLELILDIEEPYRERGADHHDRALHEQKGPKADKPDHQPRQPRNRRVRSHRAEPGLASRARISVVVEPPFGVRIKD